MCYALKCLMDMGNQTQERYKTNSKLFEYVRNLHSKNVSKTQKIKNPRQLAACRRNAAKLHILNKGRKHTEKSKKKKSIALKGRKIGGAVKPKYGIDNHFSRSIIIHNVKYDYMTLAAKVYEMSIQRIRYRCISNSKRFINWTYA